MSAPSFGMCPARGVCLHPLCVGDSLGGCAFFVVTDNDVRRDTALHPDELCHQCDHPWFQHQAKKAETDAHPRSWSRGGCPATACGGFISFDPRERWGYTTMCACGRLLRAHAQGPDGQSPMPQSSVAPPQFTSTHPALATVLPPLSARSLPLPPSFPLEPPITAFDGVREHYDGSTNGGRNASAERHRVLAAAAAGTRPPNAARARTTMLTSSAGASGSTMPLLQLRPQLTAGSSSTPSGGVASSSSAGRSGVQEFAVCFFPFVHPNIKRGGKRLGKYPHATWSFSTQEYKNLFKSFMHWGLVFTVELSTTGSVFRSLGEQVFAQLQVHGFRLPGYDPDLPWECPQDLPFLLLSGTGKDIFNKTHAPYDTFNEAKYTYANLIGKSPNLAHIPCPVGEHLIHLPHLRLAPRFGDLEGPLDNDAAFAGNAPGLQDFRSIPQRHLPHPCFPHRVMLSVVDRVAGSCLKACPIACSPTPPSPPLPPAAPRDLAPPLTPAEVEALLQAASAPSTPSPSSPFAPWLRPSALHAAVPPPLALPPPITVRQEDAPMSSDEAADPIPAVIASRAVPDVSTEPSLTQPERSARMTASGREGEPLLPIDDPMDHQPTSSMSVAGSSTGSGSRRPRPELASPETMASIPPSNRRRLDPDQPASLPSGSPPLAVGAPLLSPAMNAGVGHPEPGQGPAVVPTQYQPARVSQWACRTPLHKVELSDRKAWVDRVIAALPPPARAVNDELRHPHIEAKDAREAASVLVFLVEWLFAHDIPPTGPITKAHRDTFAQDFSERFLDDDVTCRLVALAEILRHSAHLHMEISTALGDSPIRAVLRHAIQLVVKQDKYWQSLGRYQCIRWWLNRPRRADRDSALKTAGFLSLLHLLVLECGPDPISPFLIELILTCRALTCCVDEPFMSHIDPGMLRAVQAWEDYDTNTPLPQSPDHPLYQLLIAADVDPMHFGSALLTRADIDTIERSLVSQLALGAPNVEGQLDLTAFALGFYHPFGRFAALSDTFMGRERDLIAAMCNQRLDDVGVLLARIDWESGVDEDNIDLTMLPTQGAALTGPDVFPDCVWDATNEVDFELAFRHYIVQSGHPDTPGIRAIVGPAFEEEADDPLLRARLFLAMMSGSDLVPMDEHWSIKMKFVHKGNRCPPDLEDGEEGPTPAALDIRACFCDCTVTVDEGLRNLLGARKPWKQFQAWLHGALLHSEDFNQA